MSTDWSQAFGYRFFFTPLKTSAVDLTRVNLGGLGAGKFIDNTTLQNETAKIITAQGGQTASDEQYKATQRPAKGVGSMA